MTSLSGLSETHELRREAEKVKECVKGGGSGEYCMSSRA